LLEVLRSLLLRGQLSFIHTTEPELKLSFQSLFFASALVLASSASAQGTQAARAFSPGEGNPKPDARAKVDRAQRIAATESRRQGGIAAARAFKPGEGDPKPAAGVRLSGAERMATRQATKDQVVKLNRSGRLPSYGENYGKQ
jgi:hypothetical protein